MFEQPLSKSFTSCLTSAAVFPNCHRHDHGGNVFQMCKVFLIKRRIRNSWHTPDEIFICFLYYLCIWILRSLLYLIYEQILCKCGKMLVECYRDIRKYRDFLRPVTRTLPLGWIFIVLNRVCECCIGKGVEESDRGLFCVCWEQLRNATKTILPPHPVSNPRPLEYEAGIKTHLFILLCTHIVTVLRRC